MSAARMGLLLGLLTTMAACAGDPGNPGELSAEDVAALEQIAEEDTRLVLFRDWETLAARFTSDAVRMPPNEPVVEGRTAIRQFLESLPPIEAFDFQMLDLQGDGQIAYMRGAWSITATPPGMSSVTDSGKILIVFEKQADGSWLTAADAWNSDLPLGG